ncbi:hypothetical protein Y032_0016g2992 [Ancylostoma ceylanicum]|uniref:Uncharacterized protein n=1 Tax=Ancylostoma ceylanicum TaxID=53326 RepID=A0A016V750_9BILA|nr:hypothetical protein Y032_0016g2992 [Ancylostoma ceylanicum]
MTPPVSIFDSEQLNQQSTQAQDDGCGMISLSHIVPSLDWRFRYQPTFREDKPSHCIAGTLCHDYKGMPVVFQPQGANRSRTCTLDGCSVKVPPIQMPNSLFDPGLDIEMRWEGWTSCDGNVPAQRREAHCFLMPRPGFTVDEDLEELASNIDEFKWMVKLGQLVHSESLRKKGVRLNRQQNRVSRPQQQCERTTKWLPPALAEPLDWIGCGCGLFQTIVDPSHQLLDAGTPPYHSDPRQAMIYMANFSLHFGVTETMMSYLDDLQKVREEVPSVSVRFSAVF